MRIHSATRGLGTQGATIGLAATAALCLLACPADAQTPPAPAHPVDSAGAAASVTLTTIPAGWQGRTDLAPTLQIQRDGAAVQSPDAADPHRTAETAPTRVPGRVAPDVVNSILADAESLATADLGTPPGGDGGVTLLDFVGESPEQDVHLAMYAPGSADGWSPQQRADRQRVTDLNGRLLDAFVRDR